jgi:LCP family protein required for cell wall assembly
VSQPPDDAAGAELPSAPVGARPGSARHRTNRRKAKRANRKHRKLRRTLLIVGLVLVLVILAAGSYAYYLTTEIHRVTIHHLKAAPKVGADVNTQNILMVGNTSRCVLKVQNPAYGLCSQGVTGVNADVIMILHVNPTTKSVSVLSIPRDYFIPNSTTDGAAKIDAGLADSPSQLVASIEEDLGIPIQHYVELNFDTFANVVDALGGINMYFPMPVYDLESGLNIPTPGCIHLNGTQALEVVRSRHLQYKGPGVTTDDPTYWPQEQLSDLARIRRDHEFLRVLAQAVAQKGLGNPITDAQLVSSVAGDLTVDSGFTTSDMIHLILAFHGINPYSAPQYTLPVMVSTSETYYFEGYDYGNVEFPSQPSDNQIIDQFLGLAPGQDTLNGGALPPPSSVSVSVVDGADDYSGAESAVSALQALGFNVSDGGSAYPVGQEAETLVEYSEQTPADEAAAQAVLNSLSGQVIMDYNPNMSGNAQVTVVTGTDFSVNPPATPGATTPTTKAKAAVTTTTVPPGTTTTTSVPGFVAANPALPQLAPWDPRSCTVTGGEGP